MDLLDAKAVFFDCQFKTDIDQIEMLHKGKTIFRSVKVRTLVMNTWIIEEIK